MNEAEKEKLEQLVQKSVHTLIEHCDSVQILVSYQEQGITGSIARGAGN